MTQTIAERIKQRRTQMLIHSFLYYQMGTSIVSDHQWQRWANELAELQRAHPIAIGFYDDQFDDWTGETGMHLPRDGWVHQQVLRLLSIIERNPPNPLRPGMEAPRAAPAPAPPPPAPPPPAPAPAPSRAAPPAPAAPAQFSLF